MLKNIKAVIFDLDGTMVDSVGFWKDIDNLMKEKFNIKIKKNDILKILSYDFVKSAKYFIENYDIDMTVDELMDFWNKEAIKVYTTKYSLKPGVKEYLDFLKQKEIRLAVATNNSYEIVNAFLKNNSIDNKFEYILSIKDVKRGKPYPDMYITAAEKLGIECNKCLVFEDSKPGVEAAKRAGMKVCVVKSNDSGKNFPKVIGKCDYEITDYRTLLK